MEFGFFTRSVRAMLLAGTVCTACPAFAQSSVEEIVVTAQKREQNLQNVPVSITALTQNALVANRIQDVRDLSAVVPSLTVRPAAGGAQIPNYSMRGILAASSAVGTDKGIALYVDGVYIQNSLGSIFQMADIERIEVLKGPQGTLFGRNATGGAISIITRNPTGEFGARQELTYGNYNQFRSKTQVDLPKFGPISASFTYLHSQRRGDTRNLGAGTAWDYGPATNGAIGVLTSPKYLGDENIEGVLAAVKFDFHPDLDLTYKFDYSENHYTAEAVGIGYFPTGFLTPLYLAQPAALQTPVTTKRPDAVNNAFTTPGFSRSMGHNLTARYQINDQISIKNILSFRTSKTSSTFQLDGLGGLTNNVIQVAPGVFSPPACFPGGNPGPTASCAASIGKPFAYLANNTFNSERQWSDEFQLNIQTDWFTVTAGYLHFYDHQRVGAFPDTFNTNILTAFYGQNTSAAGTAFAIPSNPGYQPSFVRVNSDAFYVQPEIHLTDRIDLIGGARITRDRKIGIETFPNQPIDLTQPRLTSPINYKNTQANYLVGLNYKPTDDILTYVKYSTGYISGGQLATIPFQPETARSLEGGIKTDLFDRRLRSNLAVFHVKYNNIQVATSGTISGVASAFPFSVAVISSANAKAYGFEWENTIVPVDGLTLTANAGYLHFKYDQNSIFGGLLPDGSICRGPTCTGGFVLQSGAPGYQRAARPTWTANVSAQYETAELMAGGHLLFRIDGNFESKNLLASDITPGTGPTAQADPALVRAMTIPAHWIFNARVAFVDFNLGGTKGQLAVWGRNIFNDDHIVQFVNLGPVGSALYERARTYGVDLSFQF